MDRVPQGGAQAQGQLHIKIRLCVTTYTSRQPFEEYDVDIAVDACGVCGSDVHSITGGWGDTPLPLCVGHEIIGKVLRVGDKVTEFKKGQRVSLFMDSSLRITRGPYADATFDRLVSVLRSVPAESARTARVTRRTTARRWSTHTVPHTQSPAL